MKSPAVGPSFLVSQVGTLAALGFAERLAPLGLKPHHAGVLRLLGAEPGLTQQALSERLGVFASVLVRLVDELEQRELVARRDSPEDRRVYRLHLTPGGKKVLERIGKVTRELENELFAALSAKETEQLAELLARVAASRGAAPGVHPTYRQLRKT